jgi:two-component system alkaline phosphatase synthesis response regulator PhoP
MIYVVEDDDSIRAMLLYALDAAGLEATGMGSGEELSAALAALPAVAAGRDMVLLDIMLPGEDGIQILRRLRSGHQTRELPVIMITAKGSEYDRIIGLDLGADDYVTKPFSVMEVVSRIKAVWRRTSPQDEGQLLEAGPVSLDAAKREVRVDGQAVTLTYKEFELLRYLLANAGLVLSRDQILSAVWGFDYSGGTRTVDMHIKTLRQKLGAGGRVVATVRNIGYKIEVV